jgi:hypothetical protein
MEDLTKQQIVLLTLLVSFVTSIATGVVTVSLMDQAPRGVVQTINQVVERTIERVVSDEVPPKTAAVVTFESQLAQSASKIAKSLIKFKLADGGPDSVRGLGLVLNSHGLVLVNKATLELPSERTLGNGILAKLPSGEEFPVRVVQTETYGDTAFAVILIPKTMSLTPVTPASTTASIQLGENIFALTGRQTVLLEEGILKALSTDAGARYDTTIAPQKVLPGSPLFTVEGEVIGFKTSSLLGDASFQSFSSLKALAPEVTR